MMRNLARLTFRWGDDQVVATYRDNDSWRVPSRPDIADLLNTVYNVRALQVGPAMGDPAHFVLATASEVLGATVTWLWKPEAPADPGVVY